MPDWDITQNRVPVIKGCGWVRDFEERFEQLLKHGLACVLTERPVLVAKRAARPPHSLAPRMPSHRSVLPMTKGGRVS